MKGDEENEEIKKEEELKELKDLKSNIFYLNNTINDFDLPLFLNDFRTQVKNLFHIESKTNDEISVIYKVKDDEDIDDDDEDENKEKDKIIEAKTNDDYISLLKRIKSDEVKDNTILIESDKVPSEISKKYPETFEEEIACVVQSELKAAADKIKKYLSGNKKCYPLVKKQKKMCSKCLRNIVGDIYRSVTNIEETIYCEKCSFSIKEPTFIIH